MPNTKKAPVAKKASIKKTLVEGSPIKMGGVPNQGRPQRRVLSVPNQGRP
jgi:hypothetical protein